MLPSYYFFKCVALSYVHARMRPCVCAVVRTAGLAGGRALVWVGGWAGERGQVEFHAQEEKDAVVGRGCDRDGDGGGKA